MCSRQSVSKVTRKSNKGKEQSRWQPERNSQRKRANAKRQINLLDVERCWLMGSQDTSDLVTTRSATAHRGHRPSCNVFLNSERICPLPENSLTPRERDFPGDRIPTVTSRW